MNREEAANILKSFLWVLRVELTLEGKDAINMAIDALSANPCDNCVGVGLAVAHGCTDMRIKKPEADE